MPEARPAAPATRSRLPSGAGRLPRYPRNAAPPVLAEVRRGGIVESRHRGHVVVVGPVGDVERAVGDPETVVTMRSTVKPLALVALIESGAADELHLSRAELAIMAASHTGEDKHVRTLQAVFRRAGISQTTLACGAVGMPVDPATAARLARDREEPGPLRHQCSGFHAASVLLSRHAGWPLEGYDQPDHPSQLRVRETVARLMGLRPAALVTGPDDCGLLTYAVPLVAVARAYLLLADPGGTATDPAVTASVPALVRIRDAMMAEPEMVGGTHEVLDTALMKRRPGALVAKGGAEGLRAVGLLAGARGPGRPPSALAIRIEDGDGFGRSNRAVTVEALARLGVLGDGDLRALEAFHTPSSRGPHRGVVATTTAGFELAPMSELVGAGRRRDTAR